MGEIGIASAQAHHRILSVIEIFHQLPTPVSVANGQTEIARAVLVARPLRFGLDMEKGRRIVFAVSRAQ